MPVTNAARSAPSAVAKRFPAWLKRRGGKRKTISERREAIWAEESKPMSNIIEIDHLSKCFGDVKAKNDLRDEKGQGTKPPDLLAV